MRPLQKVLLWKWRREMQIFSSNDKMVFNDLWGIAGVDFVILLPYHSNR